MALPQSVAIRVLVTTSGTAPVGGIVDMGSPTGLEGGGGGVELQGVGRVPRRGPQAVIGFVTQYWVAQLVGSSGGGTQVTRSVGAHTWAAGFQAGPAVPSGWLRSPDVAVIVDRWAVVGLPWAASRLAPVVLIGVWSAPVMSAHTRMVTDTSP